MNSRALWIVTAVSGAAAILVGAFGAHGLPNLLQGLAAGALQERLDWLETGSHYHLVHTVALLTLCVASELGGKRFPISVIAWLVGILLFSGCLYVMAVTGVRVLGAIVPLGGVAYTVGWAALPWAVARDSQQAKPST